MLALMLFGAISVSRMGVSLLPDVDFPQIYIDVTYTGASPELMETDVTDILEGALVGVQGVRNMYSSSGYGNADVTLEFDLNRNIDGALQDVQSAIQTVISRLPREINPPVIVKSNPENQPILWLSLAAEKPLREIMSYARNQLKDRFTSIEGVSDVILAGFLEPQIRVWLDPKKLAAYELTAADVMAAIQTEHKEIPAGRVLQEKSELNLRVLGEALTTHDIASLPVTRGANGPLYHSVSIGQLGRVEAGVEEIRRFSRSSGQPAVGVGIKKQPGTNALAVAQEVKRRIDSMKLPAGYKLGVNYDTTTYIKAAIQELNFTLVLSLLLTAVVCWLFLGSLSSTINILFAIPTSLLGTFILMKLFGFTLNYFTMLALILVIGIVVDDAIMVLENIARFQKLGHKPKEAAILGSEQILSPAIATTMAIIAVFIPVVFVDGLTGAFLFQFGVTLSVAVGLSLLEAITFTPMRLSKMNLLGKSSGPPAWVDHKIKRASVSYEKAIRWSLKRPWWIYGSAAALFAFSLFVAKILPKEFTPEEDTGSLMLRAELPLGTAFTETSRRILELEKLTLAQEGVAKTYAIIGGFSGGGEAHTAILFVTLKDKSLRKLSQKDIQGELQKKFPTLGSDMQVRAQSAGGGGFGSRRGYPVELNLKGQDWTAISKAATALKEALKNDAHFTDVDSSFQEGVPELLVIPKREAALARGVSVASLSETLQFVYNGIRAAKFNDDGRRVDIVLQADEKLAPKDKTQLSKLFIRNNHGQLISLGEVARFEEKKSLVSISRENRERHIDVYANAAKGIAVDKAIAKALEIGKKVVPESVRIETTGSSKELFKTIQSLIVALLLGIVVAYMILGSQFNSYVHPITVLLALPFSLTGAWFALYLGHSSINIYSMIGLLLLMGIVKKNSILLVEFANELRRVEKLDVREAIAGAGSVRLRPILMTSFATIAAALPPALGLGHSSASTTPMALCIVGGTLVSTLLTLFVVPLAYVHFAKLERWIDPA